MRPKTLKVAIASVLGLASFVVMLAALRMGAAGIVGVVDSIFVGALALAYVRLSVANAPTKEGTLSIAADKTVTFDGQVCARPGDLTQGFVVPTEGTLVRLDRTAAKLPLTFRLRDDGSVAIGSFPSSASSRRPSTTKS
jgi:hypothetical protein